MQITRPTDETVDEDADADADADADENGDEDEDEPSNHHNLPQRDTDCNRGMQTFETDTECRQQTCKLQLATCNLLKGQRDHFRMITNAIRCLWHRRSAGIASPRIADSYCMPLESPARHAKHTSFCSCRPKPTFLS